MIIGEGTGTRSRIGTRTRTRIRIRIGIGIGTRTGVGIRTSPRARRARRNRSRQRRQSVRALGTRDNIRARAAAAASRPCTPEACRRRARRRRVAIECGGSRIASAARSARKSSPRGAKRSQHRHRRRHRHQEGSPGGPQPPELRDLSAASPRASVSSINADQTYYWNVYSNTSARAGFSGFELRNNRSSEVWVYGAFEAFNNPISLNTEGDFTFSKRNLEDPKDLIRTACGDDTFIPPGAAPKCTEKGKVVDCKALSASLKPPSPLAN